MSQHVRKKGTQLARLIQTGALIVWDETPMIHKNCLEELDRSLQDIMSSDETDEGHQIFGKKTMLLRVDFRQIISVVQCGTKEDIIAASISISYLWKHCIMFILKTNMRLQNSVPVSVERFAQTEFAQWILNIGDGNIEATSFDEEYEARMIKIP